MMVFHSLKNHTFFFRGVAEGNRQQAGKRILMTLWERKRGRKKKPNNKQPLQDIPRYCLVANTVMRREAPKVTSAAEEMRDQRSVCTWRQPLQLAKSSLLMGKRQNCSLNISEWFKVGRTFKIFKVIPKEREKGCQTFGKTHCEDG